MGFLHKILKSLKQFLYRLMSKSTLGVRAIVFNDKNEILLVKHTYQPGWYLPGGGVHKGETFIEAVIRELREEAGIETLTPPKLFNIYLKVMQGVSDYPALYIIEKFSTHSFSSPEIQAIGWFDIYQLPADTTPATKRRLAEYFGQAAVSSFW